MDVSYLQSYVTFLYMGCRTHTAVYIAMYSHVSYVHIWIVNPIQLCSCSCSTSCSCSCLCSCSCSCPCSCPCSLLSCSCIHPCDLPGEKLIEHLKKWLDTTKLLETPHSWEPGQESDIAAAILELFHLLPQQASKFLETQGVSEPQCAYLSLLAILHLDMHDQQSGLSCKLMPATSNNKHSLIKTRSGTFGGCKMSCWPATSQADSWCILAAAFGGCTNF